jgi:hypothetical protein
LFGQPVYDSQAAGGILAKPGYLQQYRAFSATDFWEQYRWPITAVAAIIPLQSILIGYVLIRADAAERPRLAAQQRQEVASDARVGLGESGSIAHEIHQPLTAILSTQAARQLLAKSPDLRKFGTRSRISSTKTIARAGR